MTFRSGDPEIPAVVRRSADQNESDGARLEGAGVWLGYCSGNAKGANSLSSLSNFTAKRGMEVKLEFARPRIRNSNSLDAGETTRSHRAYAQLPWSLAFVEDLRANPTSTS
jgi:hypothetical protein